METETAGIRLHAGAGPLQKGSPMPSALEAMARPAEGSPSLDSSALLPAADPVYARLEDQIDWYDRKSRGAQRMFKRIKVAEIVSAAIIPFLAGLSFPTGFEWIRSYQNPIIAALGVLITILEGFLHLNQYQQLWGTYRATCEALKHEKYVYLAKAGPFATATDPHAMLAERVESLVSQEHAQWNSFQQQAGKSDTKG